MQGSTLLQAQWRCCTATPAGRGTTGRAWECPGRHPPRAARSLTSAGEHRRPHLQDGWRACGTGTRCLRRPCRHAARAAARAARCGTGGEARSGALGPPRSGTAWSLRSRLLGKNEVRARCGREIYGARTGAWARAAAHFAKHSRSLLPVKRLPGSYTSVLHKRHSLVASTLPGPAALGPSMASLGEEAAQVPLTQAMGSQLSVQALTTSASQACSAPETPHTPAGTCDAAASCSPRCFADSEAALEALSCPICCDVLMDPVVSWDCGRLCPALHQRAAVQWQSTISPAPA
jgi:hypothetical protein